MPQRTPAHTSPFQHQHQQQHQQQQPYHQQQQQFTFGEQHHPPSNNARSNGNNSSRSNYQHQSNMTDLNNANNISNNMFLFQSSGNVSVNNTCASSSNSTPPTTSFQFHNMNNPPQQGFSSNKKRKQQAESSRGNVGSSSATMESSLFYHMETDFKRKHADKKRLVWTNELHDLFVKAVSQLGLNEARPKEILELMNLPDLTTTHIKSHLQKYRQQVKKGIIPIGEGMSSANVELGSNSESETSDSGGPNEDVKQEVINSSGSKATSPFKNSQPSQINQMYSFNPTTNPNQPSSSSSQTFNSLINDTSSDQVNYIKNILLHFNQIPNDHTSSNNETGAYLSSTSQRPTQHVTFANSITNNNITTVNQPHFHLGDGRSILQNCHLLTSANSLPEFLVLLQEICKAESDMAAIFNGLPVRSTHDLNLIVEGFRIGFICGMKYKPSHQQ